MLPVSRLTVPDAYHTHHAYVGQSGDIYVRHVILTSSWLALVDHRRMAESELHRQWSG